MASGGTNYGCDRLEIYELNKALQLPHDIIDPGVKKQNAALIHPILVRLITRQDIVDVIKAE